MAQKVRRRKGLAFVAAAVAADDSCVFPGCDVEQSRVGGLVEGEATTSPARAVSSSGLNTGEHHVAEAAHATKFGPSRL